MVRLEIVRKNLERLIKKEGIKQSELARKAGITTRQMWNIIHGKNKDIKLETVEKLARALNVEVSELTEDVEEKRKRLIKGVSNLIPTPKSTVTIPVYGRIPAGTPREVWHDYVEEYIYIPDIPENAFGLIVAGDSMIGEGIEEGDIVIIDPNTIAYNGDIVVAVIDGSEFTLKKFYKDNKGHYVLAPANEHYQPLIFTEEEFYNRVYIVGVILGLYKKMRKRGRIIR